VNPGRPTLDTVAHAAGVSRMTVSNAYNRPDQLSEDTRLKVLRVAQELGYPGPDPAGRSLRRRRADTVGVLLTERLPYAFSDPGTVAFLHGVAAELADAGQALLLLPTEANADHALVRGALVDGFVLVSLAPDDPAVADVLGRRLPAVSWGEPKIAGVRRVGIDNARAVEPAARHLLELGHRRFAVVTFGSSPATTHRGGEPAVERVTTPPVQPEPADAVVGTRMALRQRVTGFLRALADAGIDTADVDIARAERNSRTAGAQAARDLLTGPAGGAITAIFAVTDVLALGVLDAAAELGIAVPRQLSVVGFDDIAEASRSTPPLTTISQSLFDHGRLAARVVLDLVGGGDPRVPRLRTELVLRASTATPALRRP
jgi:DNA-binding LacI/PurR family transcriptional regulator